ncbi:MAG: HPr family phosphocarrier protein [Armatimonadota bacterium]|nr:HPr family phosphocarrier protein [Armatimonadota bacterium]MDR7516274.1 HPr family phosphocarrier protein [Armatimonadota bacterium]MDR7559955.1 HPr family phosphocarrier protein [Armatimonadota bacterium]MDR7587689.1 HPr family phosphocarrier protein [Armatimonadota bacterium]MDR7611482.1 HPr family phosphocarrier protein [Armatimonadota bacterium]
MKRLRLTVVNEVGLHARPAAVFVSEAGRFASRIQVRNATTDSGWVDAKSILSVLTLGVEQNHEIEIAVEGPDEDQAAAALERLVASDFAGRL